MFVGLAMAMVSLDNLVEEGSKGFIALVAAGVASDTRVSILTT